LADDGPAVDPISDALVIDLGGVAGRAGDAQPRAIPALILDEADGQPVRILGVRPSGQVAEPGQVPIVPEGRRLLRLLQGEEPVVGDDLRTQRRGVESLAVLGRPALIEIGDFSDPQARGVGARRGVALRGHVIPMGPRDAHAKGEEQHRRDRSSRHLRCSEGARTRRATLCGSARRQGILS